LPPEPLKKLIHVERAGRDIKKVLQQLLFMLTIDDEKFNM
jgi:hypothetical protein